MAVPEAVEMNEEQEEALIARAKEEKRCSIIPSSVRCVVILVRTSQRALISVLLMIPIDHFTPPLFLASPDIIWHLFPYSHSPWACRTSG